MPLSPPSRLIPIAEMAFKILALAALCAGATAQVIMEARRINSCSAVIAVMGGAPKAQISTLHRLPDPSHAALCDTWMLSRDLDTPARFSSHSLSLSLFLSSSPQTGEGQAPTSPSCRLPKAVTITGCSPWALQPPWAQDSVPPSCHLKLAMTVLPTAR